MMELVISKIIADQLPDDDQDSQSAAIVTATLWLLADSFVPLLAFENPNFDRSRFLRLCGLEREDIVII